MAAPLKRLALDTNILFDLATGEDFAHDFRETFQEECALWVPPTVVAELAHKASERESETQQLALAALQSLLSWGIRPYDLRAVGHGITESFAKYLIRERLLPDNEFHDGVILAETALGDIPILATSDKHLLNIDESDLKLAFDAQDLMQVTPLHPRNLRRALLRKKNG